MSVVGLIVLWVFVVWAIIASASVFYGIFRLEYDPSCPEDFRPLLVRQLAWVGPRLGRWAFRHRSADE